MNSIPQNIEKLLIENPNILLNLKKQTFDDIIDLQLKTPLCWYVTEDSFAQNKSTIYYFSSMDRDSGQFTEFIDPKNCMFGFLNIEQEIDQIV